MIHTMLSHGLFYIILKIVRGSKNLSFLARITQLVTKVACRNLLSITVLEINCQGKNAEKTLDSRLYNFSSLKLLPKLRGRPNSGKTVLGSLQLF